MCADAPDQTGINAAALANANLSKESLDWYKQIYAESAPDRAKAAATNEKVSNAQLSALDSNTALSNDYANYQKNTYRPLEQGIVADAASYDTEARRDSEAGKAIADVTQGFSSAREQNARSMARMGVNPSSGRTAAMGNQTAIAQASAQASAAAGARQNVETQGYARKMDAANLGRGLASNQATSAGIALNAGNSAVSNAGQTLAQGNQAAQQMGQGWGTAINANNSAGQLYGQSAQRASQDSGLMGALGGVAGQFAGSKAGSALISGWMSDENVKKDIKPMSDEDALAAVNETPIKKWKYDPAKLAEQGIPMPSDAQGENIGPMAQKVNETMGEEAAPGGVRLNPVTMNGVNMASIKAVDKKVVKLTKEVSTLAKMIRGEKIQAGVSA